MKSLLSYKRVFIFLQEPLNSQSKRPISTFSRKNQPLIKKHFFLFRNPAPVQSVRLITNFFCHALPTRAQKGVRSRTPKSIHRFLFLPLVHGRIMKTGAFFSLRGRRLFVRPCMEVSHPLLHKKWGIPLEDGIVFEGWCAHFNWV